MAWKRRDLAATFRWSRLLGGRRWGAKKRDYRAMSAALPLKKAWKDEWTKPGAEGGMGAVELESWSEWRIQSRDLVRRSELNARVSEDARRDMEELKSSYRTVKKEKSLPSRNASCRTLHASRNLSPAGLGIGYQRKRIEPVRTLSLLERLLCRVRSSGAAPLAWHHSSGAPHHKSNKAGPKGKRVVHVLPLIGKQFFKVLLGTRRDGWTPPAPADWLHGYIPGRRRESAILIRQATTWRLERLGLKSLTAFHDLTNAFGSVKWEAMDRAAAALLGPNHLLGQQRYRLATTTIPGNDGDISLKIGEGGLMGDPLMVALFWVAFLPSTIRWQQLVAEEGAESGQCILGRVKGWTYPCRSMPMTQPNRLWQSRARMSRRLQSECGAPTTYLIVRWQLMVFQRIEAKRSFSCIWWGLVLWQIDGWCERGRSLPGKVVTVARHLGSHLGEKASFTHELPRRRQATVAAFYSVGQLWYESRVSWRLKRCFFISRVVNTALSCIEAFCPSKAQYQALTSLVTCLARRAQRHEGVSMGESAH